MTRKPKHPEFDLLRLTDYELSLLAQETAQELHRRVLDVTESLSHRGDPFTRIKGQEMCKRALTVAIAGKHSILFCGPPGCGKTMLRYAAHRLGLDETYEARYCPCGWWSDPRRECRCSPSQVSRHQAHWPVTDIFIEACSVPERELAGAVPGTGIVQIREAVAAIPPESESVALQLTDDGQAALATAVAELGLDARQRSTILRVARSIALLDRCTNIRLPHIYEAINYRSTGRPN
jgi:predicted ATPase with chaperone activity